MKKNVKRWNAWKIAWATRRFLRSIASVPRNTVSTWLRNIKKILCDLEKSSTNPKRKKMPIYWWLYWWRWQRYISLVSCKGNQNVLKGEVLLKRKSLDSAKQLDQPDFKGSDCWLSNRIKGSLLSGFLS